MKKLVTIAGAVATRSGYGNHTRDIVRALINSEKYEVNIISLPWGNCPMTALSPDTDQDIISRIIGPQLNRQPDIFIQISVPNEFQAVGKYNIGITAGIETTACAPEWIEGCNRMNKIITVSNHSRDIFLKTVFDKIDEASKQKIGELRVTTPVEVLFEGVDTDVFTPQRQLTDSVITELKDIPEKFCFLFVGHWLKGDIGQDRKDVGMLVKVFAELFKNKPPKSRPALILKTSGATFSIMDRDEIMRKLNFILQPYGNTAPNVYLLHGDMTEPEINALYNHPKIKAMVSFTKGEGYGRPLAEFACIGKPIIATNWSGHIDFLDNKYTLLIPGKLTEIHESATDNHLMKGSQWFTVDYNAAAQAMFAVYSNYDAYLVPAKKQMERMQNMFTLEHMNKQLIDMIENEAQSLPTPMQLVLPKLRKIENTETPKITLPKLKKIEATA